MRLAARAIVVPFLGALRGAGKHRLFKVQCSGFNV
jgi:hypothetical protein